MPEWPHSAVKQPNQRRRFGPCAASRSTVVGPRSNTGQCGVPGAAMLPYRDRDRGDRVVIGVPHDASSHVPGCRRQCLAARRDGPWCVPGGEHSGFLVPRKFRKFDMLIVVQEGAAGCSRTLTRRNGNSKTPTSPALAREPRRRLLAARVRDCSRPRLATVNVHLACPVVNTLFALACRWLSRHGCTFPV